MKTSIIDINTLIALCSFVLALFTTAAGAILWYVNSEKKKYASERDFQHLKRNLESISAGIAELLDRLETKLDTMERSIGRDILEIKMHIVNKKNNPE